MAFDRRGILALRNLANLGEPLGPPRLQKAQDVTSLGSIVVVTITTLAVVGYLLPSRERAEALWRSPCSASIGSLASGVTFLPPCCYRRWSERCS